jgi:hypothetical protein
MEFIFGFVCYLGGFGVGMWYAIRLGYIKVEIKPGEKLRQDLQAISQIQSIQPAVPTKRPRGRPRKIQPTVEQPEFAWDFDEGKLVRKSV